MGITAEDADDAEDTEEKGLPIRETSSIHFTQWVTEHVPGCGHPNLCFLRVFRVLRILRGNSIAVSWLNLKTAIGILTQRRKEGWDTNGKLVKYYSS